MSHVAVACPLWLLTYRSVKCDTVLRIRSTPFSVAVSCAFVSLTSRQPRNRAGLETYREGLNLADKGSGQRECSKAATTRPAALNFFFEGKSTKAIAFVAKNQALYDGSSSYAQLTEFWC